MKRRAAIVGFLPALLSWALLTTNSPARAADDAMSGWRPLLDKQLSQWDVYLSYRGDQISAVLDGKAPAGLAPLGLNPRGQDVFTVIEEDGKPVLRISGEIYGCAATRESFSNYHLRAKVKWGEKIWQPRLTEPKDSGILYHSRGDFGVDYWKSWALSQEFQIIEHGIGDYWSIANSYIDIRASRQAGEQNHVWDARATQWTTFGSPLNHCRAGSDQERPGWNTIELVCFADDCVHVVNGKVVMALANARYRSNAAGSNAAGSHAGGDAGFVAMTGGKLQIQSEAAEVFFKDVEIRPVGAMPPEYSGFFR